MKDNEVSLIKSETVSLDGFRSLLVLYYYHRAYTEDEKGVRHTDQSKSFYRCAVRVDLNSIWKELAESIPASAPADLFNLRSIGMESQDYILLVKNHLTNTQARKWLLKKFRGAKIHTLQEFLNGHCLLKNHKHGHRTRGAFDTELPYIKDYIDGNNVYHLDNPEEFPTGRWFYADRLRMPRRPPKVIKD